MFTLTTKLTRFSLNLFAALAALAVMSSAASAQVPKLNSNLAAKATVYLDFDGETVKGTAWNWDSTIHARPAALKQAQILEIFNRVAEDYHIFNINITTDPNVYTKAPVNRRVRVILTPTSQWYGVAGGIAFVNSFTWGDGTPAWVFTNILQNNAKYIGEAASHEAGHTLGLQHQSTYTSKGILVKEYAEGRGTGETGWAPIMGLGYYKNVTTWTIGTSIEGPKVFQNDISLISNGFNHIGLRADDRGNTRQTAFNIPCDNKQFKSNGNITTSADKDVFKVILVRHSLLHLVVAPVSVGSGSAGANIDIKLSLLRANGDTIGRYNPPNLLSVSLDTNLSAGTYYLVVDGTGNQNLPEYGSVGPYNIDGTLQVLLPVVKLSLQGRVMNKAHVIDWDYVSDEPVKSAIVEVSSNGVNFTPLSILAPAIKEYKNTPFGNGSMYYRIKMLAGQEEVPYYSNIIQLMYTTQNNISLYSNLIRNMLQVSVLKPYHYELLDESGRLYQRGRLTRGINIIAVNTTKTGLFFLKVFDQQEQQTFRLLKR